MSNHSEIYAEAAELLRRPGDAAGYNEGLQILCQRRPCTRADFDLVARHALALLDDMAKLSLVEALGVVKAGGDPVRYLASAATFAEADGEVLAHALILNAMAYFNPVFAELTPLLEWPGDAA